MSPGNCRARRQAPTTSLEFLAATFVEEIHGYTPAHGLRIISAEALVTAAGQRALPATVTE